MADTPSPPNDLDQYVDVIAKMLSVQIDGHERLHALLKTKRDAIRTANFDGLMSVCRDEQMIIQKLTDLERNRLQIVDEVARVIGHRGEKRPTVEIIAAQTDAPRAERLRGVAARLRGLVESVRDESAVLARAAQTLSRHMSGLMQTMQRTLNETGVYERAGRIASGQTTHCIDLKS